MENKAKKVCSGKCSSTYCGDCAYFNGSKYSFGKNYCEYYKMYSRNSDDLACAHFRRG